MECNFSRAENIQQGDLNNTICDLFKKPQNKLAFFPPMIMCCALICCGHVIANVRIAKDKELKVLEHKYASFIIG